MLSEWQRASLIITYKGMKRIFQFPKHWFNIFLSFHKITHNQDVKPNHFQVSQNKRLKYYNNQ